MLRLETHQPLVLCGGALPDSVKLTLYMCQSPLKVLHVASAQEALRTRTEESISSGFLDTLYRRQIGFVCNILPLVRVDMLLPTGEAIMNVSQLCRLLQMLQSQHEILLLDTHRYHALLHFQAPALLSGQGLLQVLRSPLCSTHSLLLFTCCGACFGEDDLQFMHTSLVLPAQCFKLMPMSFDGHHVAHQVSLGETGAALALQQLRLLLCQFAALSGEQLAEMCYEGSLLLSCCSLPLKLTLRSPQLRLELEILTGHGLLRCEAVPAAAAATASADAAVATAPAAFLKWFLARRGVSLHPEGFIVQARALQLRGLECLPGLVERAQQALASSLSLGKSLSALDQLLRKLHLASLETSALLIPCFTNAAARCAAGSRLNGHLTLRLLSLSLGKPLPQTLVLILGCCQLLGEQIQRAVMLDGGDQEA
mmetsp:Transcript_102065/g.186504  ORF Transcript_102065/g.186504 Transcript_102065/m.186504 type:complete len:425 (-) Transcript_102065:70-1344(-)